MKQDNSVKWIISIILSVGIGTLIINILGNIEVNVWITRIAGGLVTAITGLLFYYLWIKKTKKE